MPKSGRLAPPAALFSKLTHINHPSRSQAPKTSTSEAQAWMLFQLPNAENPNIDKYAILLRPIPENPEPHLNVKGKPKMIGLTGTNRMSPQGLENGYCLNLKYWGKGYATEAYAAFLQLYWGLTG